MTQESVVIVLGAVIFALALIHIWGWGMVKDILLSPLRSYDFDEAPPVAKADSSKDGQ